MKKLFAIIIVAVLAISCTSVFASENKININTEEENADVKEQFLRWLLTSDSGGRFLPYENFINEPSANLNAEKTTDESAMADYILDKYQNAAGSATGESAVADYILKRSQNAAESTIVEPIAANPEFEKEVLDEYYKEISGIVDEDLLEQMAKSRMPMKYDQYFAEHEIKTEYVDAVFSEGEANTFIKGSIYNFDARVRVEVSEDYPDFPYLLDQDGCIHITGYVAVNEGLITKLYISESLEKATDEDK